MTNIRTSMLATCAMLLAPATETGTDKGDGIPPMFQRKAATEPSKPAPVAVEVKAELKPATVKLKDAVAKSVERQAKKTAKASEPKAKKAKPVKAEPDLRPSNLQNSETEATPKLAKSIVPDRYKKVYAATQGTCGDKLALALKAATTTVNKDGRAALDVPALKAIAEQNGIDFARYAAMNGGQQRMNVGNRLRGLLKNDEKVHVGKQTFANAEKALHKEPVAEKKAA